MNEQHDNFNQIIKLITNKTYSLFLYKAYKNTDIYDYEYIRCILLSNGNLNIIIYNEYNIINNFIIEKKNINCLFKVSCKTSEYIIITQFDLNNNILYLYDLNGNEFININNNLISDIEPYFINDEYNFSINKNTIQIYNKSKIQILLILLDYDNTIIFIKHNNIIQLPLINNINFNIEKDILPVGNFRPLLESKLYDVLNIIYVPNIINNNEINFNCGGENLKIEKFNLNYNLLYNDNILSTLTLIDDLNYELYFITSSKVPIFSYIIYNKILNESNIYNYKNVKINNNIINGLIFIIDVFIEQNIVLFNDQTNFNLSKILIDKLYVDFNFLKTFSFSNYNNINNNDVLSYNLINKNWTNKKINDILDYVDGGMF